MNDIVNGDAGATVTTDDEPAPSSSRSRSPTSSSVRPTPWSPPAPRSCGCNADTDIHSIISTGELFASSDTFEPGETYSVMFSEPGTYAYTCGVHPFMTGTITVE